MHAFYCWIEFVVKLNNVICCNLLRDKMFSRFIFVLLLKIQYINCELLLLNFAKF